MNVLFPVFRASDNSSIPFLSLELPLAPSHFLPLLLIPLSCLTSFFLSCLPYFPLRVLKCTSSRSFLWVHERCIFSALAYWKSLPSHLLVWPHWKSFSSRILRPCLCCLPGPHTALKVLIAACFQPLACGSFPTVSESFLAVLFISGNAKLHVDRLWCGCVFIHCPGKFRFRDICLPALEAFHVLFL